MTKETVTIEQLVGDCKKQIVGHFGEGIHKEIVVRTHVRSSSLLYTFIEVHHQGNLIYSGQDLEEAIEMYNSH